MADRLHYVRRRRPELLRVAMRTARGVGPAQIAKECMTAPEMIEALAKEPDFAALVEGCKAAIDLPADERLAVIESLALDFLELAIAERDVRVMLYFCDQLAQGRNPAKVLAAGINQRIEASKRPQRPPRLSKSAPPRPQSSRESVTKPWAGAMRAGAARLRAEILNALATSTETQETTACVQKHDDRTVRTPGSNVKLPTTSTAPIAILVNHCRDGPR
ncbi:MAG: hypothetical protein AAFY56_12835 [Pseudomonadota bacterium]